MKSLATLVNLATSLSQNTSAANQLLMLQLINDQHRYLLQDFFDNERSFQTTTVGGASLTLTGSLSANATSATLTATWAYPTVQQLVNFSNSDQRLVLFTNGSAAISWTGGLSSSATTAISSIGVQKYAIPAMISKVKNDFIQVGQLRYVPAPVQTRDEWDRLNFLPYTSDIVNYFYIYNGFVEFFPIPSTTGNIIQFNYKARVPDFSTGFLFSSASAAAFSAGSTAYDYQKGTLASGLTVGSTAITGAATAWTYFPQNVDVSYYNLYLNIAPLGGDGFWYPISQFTSDTTLTLATPLIFAPASTAATYSIAQLPVLQEDFHDMIVYGALKTYFNSIVKRKDTYTLYKDMYDERYTALDKYAGTKSTNVDLGAQPQMVNPNLFLYGNGN